MRGGGDRMKRDLTDVDIYVPPVKMSPQDEGLCMDSFISEDEKEEGPGKRFCRVFRVSAAVKSVGLVHASHDSSPSKPFEVNPKLNCSFAVDSVFRILRSNDLKSYEFGTGWMAAPGKLLPSGKIAYYFVSVYHLFQNWETASFFGCFGESSKEPKDFMGGHGFPIKFSDPLFYTEQTEEADLCVIRFTLRPEEARVSIPEGVSYLLPCTLDDSRASESGLASFGYPGVKAFMLNAERELQWGWKEKEQEVCLWDRYQACFSSKNELLKAIQAALQHLKTGYLCCSPATFQSVAGNFVYFESSAIPGCSGSPLMSNTFEGYVVATFKGTVGVGREVQNRATLHDFPDFVRFYEKEILPMIPHHIHRDPAPFRRWIDKHNLDWPNRQSRVYACSSVFHNTT